MKNERTFKLKTGYVKQNIHDEPTWMDTKEVELSITELEQRVGIELSYMESSEICELLTIINPQNELSFQVKEV